MYPLTAEQVGSLVRPELSGPRDMSRVEAALSDSNQRLSMLHESITQLEHRLIGVLRPPQPAASESAPKNGKPVETKIADSINYIGEGVAVAATRLQELIQRLEL